MEATAVAGEVEPDDTARAGMPRSVAVFVGFLSVAAIAVCAGAYLWGAPLSIDKWPMLLVFCALLVAAERLDVRFRLHGQVEALNLSEAVIAPLIFAFQTPAVMVVVAVAQLIAGLMRRNEGIKIAFNGSQWSLAAGVGSLVYTSLVTHGNEPTLMVAILLAMIGVGAVNQLALSTVLRLAQRRTVRSFLSNISRVFLPGWLMGWGLNTLVGMLFVLAYSTNAFATALFFVPLGVLHAAYRGYAGMESDRMRLAGLHRASRKLAASADLDNAMAGFLAETCRCFEAQVASLWLKRGKTLIVYQVNDADVSTYTKQNFELQPTDLRWKILELGETMRARADDDGPLAQQLRFAAHRDCLMTPLPSPETLTGILAVFDQNGLEGFEEGEQAVIEALARETTSSIERGRLFQAVVEERHKLSQILDNTHDGVLNITAEGVVRSWNPGWEQITGYSAFAAVGRRLSETIDLFDMDGRPVILDNWAHVQGRMPRQLQLLDRNSQAHWLDCSYRVEVDDAGSAGLLAVIAHDVTDEREIEQLREDNDRLAELEAVQRSKVLQLQESLQPDIPEVPESEFGVHYEPSDRSAPTGGDFYDWQTLASGDVHIAVVDVLGHGIEATNDALALIHTLRTLAFQGTPVEHLVSEADQLLASLDNELVATVICARYRPSTGECRLAGGGHPPALLVHPNGTVDEIAAPGIPVGWPMAGSDRAVDIVLDAGDTLIFYTDGLVEARRDILLGLEQLADHAREARTLPADALARQLVEASLEGADRRDDSLALVLRHSAAQVYNASGFGHRSAPDMEEVPALRHRFSNWLAGARFDEEAIEDLTIAITELASNAARVAQSYFEVRAALIPDGVIIEVEDDGPGLVHEDLFGMLPDPESESGRGLLIVRTLVDEFTVRATGAGTVVRARKTVVRPNDQQGSNAPGSAKRS